MQLESFKEAEEMECVLDAVSGWLMPPSPQQLWSAWRVYPAGI